MNIYLDIIKYKLRALFTSKHSFSNIIFDTSFHETTVIRKNSRIYNSTVGRYTYICRNALIQNTVIGSFCSISEGCNIGLPSHPIDMVSTSPVFLAGGNYLKKNFSNFEYEESKKTYIGSDVWIGANVLIRDGLTIGDGAVIGMGSIVTHDIPPYEVWAGNPARFIKKRFNNDTIEFLQRFSWWSLPDEKLYCLSNSFISPSLLINKCKRNDKF